ncbi:glycerol kinase [Catalinimonas alkaloidigena]|uniref:ATP:glycerol 3-phosphotransferase n=1 Tax=Catalinimonas alkaloidigena TaxID=1075417 RepID=A0A1G9KLL2_9BACT|nr:glycerol kinase GlpK [Catalinimonas alkaloidigena]SDL50559.1 glycerol kinase [Catalinimonas alkaloidigena]
MTSKYILAIDQGTSSTKTLVFDAQGRVQARGSVPLKTQYLSDGWVEQEPEAILQNVLDSVEACLEDFKAKGGKAEEIAAGGVSNQRETLLIWDETGTPLHPAIVWQCKRSIGVCQRLAQAGFGTRIKEKTGLFIDPYFSGSKVIWLYENDARVRQAIDEGRAYFGTVDTWLLYKLTNGEKYLTDHTNASRTLFFNIHTLAWDQELLDAFGLSKLKLPDVQPSSSHFGASDFGGLFPQSLPITAMIGDSHAAAFGEGCFEPGTAKATLGTGCSILKNIGPVAKPSAHGMVTTLCWSTEERIDFALEGVIVTCGGTIEWLKNELGLIRESRETEALATAVPDNGGVYLIPAFSGLGAPHWQMDRKASISGLTFGSTKQHLIRAALESIPYQIKDVIVAMEQDTGLLLQELMVNGGMTANGFVLQFLADLLGKSVVNQGMPDVSAQGAAFLAGLKANVYPSLDYLKQLKADPARLSPAADRSAVDRAYAGWQQAVGTVGQSVASV